MTLMPSIKITNLKKTSETLKSVSEYAEVLLVLIISFLQHFLEKKVYKYQNAFLK